MGATESKLRCLFLPAQSGKTRKVQEEIRTYKDICRLTSTRSLDILISANNRLLVYQTTSRMKKDLGAGAGADSDTASIDTEDPTAIAAAEEEETVPSNAAIEGAIFSWTSGAVSNIKPSELMLQILVGDVEMLLLCANRRRLNYLAEMLLLLTSHRRFRADPIDINIWIDEADSSISIWRTYPQILTLPAVTRVTLVSATFDSVLRRYGALRVIPYAVTHPDVYRRLRDCTRRIVPCPRGLGTEDYILQVLCGTDHARLTAPGQRAFIPGDFTKDSHAMIAEVLGALGFTVILLNGERKELLIPGQAPRDLREHLTITDPDTIPEEFNQTLAQLYTDLDLARFPLAITGYLCIQRGVTFQCAPTDTHGGFVFDYGIIPPIRLPAEAYQMTARLFGNVGAFPNYIAPATIYTDEGTFDRIEREEEAAVNLPRMVHAESLETVTAEDFKRAVFGPEIPVINNDASPFETLEDASLFLRTVLGRIVRLGDRTFHNIDGYLLSTRLLSYYKKASSADLVAADRLTLERYHQINPRTNISTNKGQHYMIYPVYPTLDAPPEAVRFYVRFLLPSDN